jgi:hypothetical protein
MEEVTLLHNGPLYSNLPTVTVTAVSDDDSSIFVTVTNCTLNVCVRIVRNLQYI